MPRSPPAEALRRTGDASPGSGDARARASREHGCLPRARRRRSRPEPPYGGPAMSTADESRILVIANRTASTPQMLDQVAERARSGARFTLLIPPDHRGHDDWSRDDALRLVGRAAETDVAYLDSGPDALD